MCKSALSWFQLWSSTIKVRCPDFSCDPQLLQCVGLISALIVMCHSAFSWFELWSSTIKVRCPDFSCDRHLLQCVVLISAVIIECGALSWLQLWSSIAVRRPWSSSITVRCPDFSCNRHLWLCVGLISAVYVVMFCNVLFWFRHVYHLLLHCGVLNFIRVRHQIQCVLLISAVFIVIYSVIMAFRHIYASRLMHRKMLQRLMRAPMSFFDTTPLGRIVNRFSQDMDMLDSEICVDIEIWWVVQDAPRF